MGVHQNFINGDWAQAREQAPNINPSNTSDVVGEYARADEAQARAAIAAARAAVAGLGARPDPGARRPARQDRQRDPGAQGRARHAARARGRQDQARRHRRSDARRVSLQVLRRRGGAPGRRGAAFGASRHQGRDHARADRRGRHHHAVELPDRHPGVEDRARRSPTATAWCSSPPTWCPAAPGRSPRSSAAPACRPACSTW